MGRRRRASKEKRNSLQRRASCHLNILGHDELCLIMTCFTDSLIVHYKCNMAALSNYLFALCTRDSVQHMMMELRRYYFVKNSVVHRTLSECYAYGLDTWSIKIYQNNDKRWPKYFDESTSQLFEFTAGQRCSVLFKNGSWSSLMGFIVSHQDRLSLIGIQSKLEEMKFFHHNMGDKSIVCPIFRKTIEE